ncbi:MAG: hypothetical protein PHI85_00535 [Victivallaceae bacterium]|nr:hypothetical protein [Victivallaceae bacterium]
MRKQLETLISKRGGVPFPVIDIELGTLDYDEKSPLPAEQWIQIIFELNELMPEAEFVYRFCDRPHADWRDVVFTGVNSKIKTTLRINRAMIGEKLLALLATAELYKLVLPSCGDQDEIVGLLRKNGGKALIECENAGVSPENSGDILHISYDGRAFTGSVE